ncbi:MAG TPA: tetratricopeptide repeat protein [Thermoanaerobaculales bacterium]|nr:tetratricopeptide repeat protein [Thermoanaerobaculales bacterium]HPA81114.1 tetratricopeptide repeat protein [Thermoanaerobaculales bacterium]HQL31024.1 tetratricopeptide repeat protein [Thermoanaerobaculales bacterium]HQN96641.1 tetratricopeptide repeat protein [Thermoanaerobaculales bacterium]HQP43295.1 tetratricopeptide repeat protein [Thermoanaerobaculales bacterium]
MSSLPTVSLAAAGRILATLALAVPCAAARPAGVAPVDDDVAGGGAVERHCAAELQSAFDALDAGDAARALDHYRAAVGMATTDALRFQALLGLGSTYAALQRYDEAVAALKRARSLAPESADAWYTLGSVYAAAGRTDDALRALGEAARLQPGHAAAHTDLCLLLSRLGRHADAAASCRSAVEADATRVPAWIGLGVATYQLGDYEASSAAFGEALRRQADSGRACYGLGLSRLFAGDRDGAVAQYLRLKELDPALARDLYLRIFP